jgi:prenyltransferase beta subunit
MYLSSIQVGIQNAHCLVNIGRKYNNDNSNVFILESDVAARSNYIDWSDNYKTMVCLNGGNQANLKEIVDIFCAHDNPFAWNCFYEDEQSLNNCLTCVGIILPERIYDAAQRIREDRTGQFVIALQNEFIDWEFKLMSIINSCRLAN